VQSSSQIITRFILSSNYRATLCVSAVFAAVARCLCVRLSVCLSVCLSRSRIASRRLKISSNFFLCPVAPSFQFFDSWRRCPIPREPLLWGRKIHGAGKICDIQLKSPFITETVRDRLMVAMERYRKSYTCRWRINTCRFR